MTTREKLLFLTQRGVTITEFSRRVNCNKNTLSQWLRGKSNLSKRLEQDVADAIDSFLIELNTIKE